MPEVVSARSGDVNDRRGRICLISPAHLSTNPRMVKEADALCEAGYDVTVIAATYQPWARQADRGFASRPWRIAPPLAFGPHAPRGRRVAQIARHRIGRWLAGGGVRHPSVVHAAIHQVGPDLASAAKRTAADLYIAHYPAALPAAALAAKRNGGLYAFDAEDFHPGEREPGAGHDRERKRIEAIEGAYLPGCAYVTAASPGIADAYADTYGLARPSILLNVFPRAQGPDHATPRGSAVPGPSVYWFSQTIGPHRGLETAIRAIGQAKSRPHLYLRGTPAFGFREHLEVRAREAGVADRLHILPPGLPEEMVRLASGFDIGLVGETGYTRNRRIALTNKQFTYLLAGVPALMSDIDAHRGIAAGVETGMTLYRAEDPTSLAAAMDRLLECPTELAAARAAAFRLGQERFNWDIEKGALVACVEHALALHRRAGR